MVINRIRHEAIPTEQASNRLLVDAISRYGVVAWCEVVPVYVWCIRGRNCVAESKGIARSTATACTWKIVKDTVADYRPSELDSVFKRLSHAEALIGLGWQVSAATAVLARVSADWCNAHAALMLMRVARVVVQVSPTPGVPGPVLSATPSHCTNVGLFAAVPTAGVPEIVPPVSGLEVLGV